MSETVIEERNVKFESDREGHFHVGSVPLGAAHKDESTIRNYTEWRRTHLNEYDSVEELSRHAEEFSMKLRRLGTDAIRQIDAEGYKTFEEIEAAIDARLKANAAMM